MEANYNRANLLEERNDLDNAILFYWKAIHEDPKFADAHFNLARALGKSWKMQEAKADWQRDLDLDSSSEWATHVKGRLVVAVAG